VTAAAVVLLLAGGAALLWFWYAYRARSLTVARLAEMVEADPEPVIREDHLVKASTSYPPRYRYAPVSLGCILAAGLRFFAGLPIEIAVAAGALVGVIAHLVEEQVAEQRTATIEMQLAQAIDLLVGSLRAGASLLAAFESALQESERPLKPYLQDVAGRIRLGDDPRAAVSELPARVPLETFRLFATSLAVHWEVGGSLATTLGTVGRTVRDRIELSRRVRAQGVEAHASVAVVLFLAYLLGILMWRTNPERLEAFVATGLGTGLVAMVMALQAIGLVWMSKLSRPDY
jgi:tight adherence protein B